MSVEQLYVQEAHLPLVFDLSTDWFRERKNKLFFEGKHFFPTESSSKTKKAILWHLKETELVLRSHVNLVSEIYDGEVTELLSRLKAV